jgi:hypothetical protein
VVTERFQLDMVHCLTIIPTELANGSVDGVPDCRPEEVLGFLSRYPKCVDQERRVAVAYAMYALAGEISEWICLPEAERPELGDHLDEEWGNPYPQHDFNRARRALVPFEPNEERRERWLTRLVHRTEKLLAQPKMWAAVQQLAGALLRAGTLEGEALMQEMSALKMPRRWAGKARNRRPVSPGEPA